MVRLWTHPAVKYFAGLDRRSGARVRVKTSNEIESRFSKLGNNVGYAPSNRRLLIFSELRPGNTQALSVNRFLRNESVPSSIVPVKNSRCGNIG